MPRSVDEKRWQRAQEWELAFWLREQKPPIWKRIGLGVLGPLLRPLGSPLATGDDWNLWWREQFDNYEFLPRDLGDYIELGCGPYTNTRLIVKGREARRIICSDPLAREYLNFKKRWLARAHEKGLVTIDSHAIEELTLSPQSFDTVVLINVLDHVLDAERCMEIATGLLRPGGYLIFGQDLADPASFGNREYEWFEEGHPIRLTAEDVSPWLKPFETVLEKTVPPRDKRLQTGVLVFAGTKLDSSPAALPRG
ncbi:MAG: class I SAM-dependent methyltransferase [Candidatus Binatia bacterium]